MEQLDDIELDLVRKAAHGQDIKDTRKQAAFVLLFTQAKAEAIRARNALVAVDPHDWKLVQAHQNDVKRYEEMAEWVRVAIIEGEQAFAQLLEHRGESGSDDTAAEPD